MSHLISQVRGGRVIRKRRVRQWLWVVSSCIIAFSGHEVAAVNIAVSGFNADVVTELATTRFAHRFDYTETSLVEQGVFSISPRVVATVGLPVSRTFLSQSGSGVTYQLQPYDTNNALRMGDDAPSTGIITVIPGQYSALHILAGSGMDASVPMLTEPQPMFLDFADGSVAASFKPYDWAAPGNGYALGGLVRNFFLNGGLTSTEVHIDEGGPAGYKLWETSVDLNALGASGRVLQQIRFVDNFPSNIAMNVMAIDGTPAPEPSCLLPILVMVSALRRSGRGGVLLKSH